MAKENGVLTSQEDLALHLFRQVRSMGCLARGKLNSSLQPVVGLGAQNTGPNARPHPVSQEMLSSPLYSCDDLLHLGIH